MASRIVCGWCGHTTAGNPCSSCGRDSILPWTQRNMKPPEIQTDAAGRPGLDVNDVRRQLAAAAEVIKGRGQAATVARLAEQLGVSDKTVRRWREMVG